MAAARSATATSRITFLVYPRLEHTGTDASFRRNSFAIRRPGDSFLFASYRRENLLAIVNHEIDDGGGCHPVDSETDRVDRFRGKCRHSQPRAWRPLRDLRRTIRRMAEGQGGGRYVATLTVKADRIALEMNRSIWTIALVLVCGAANAQGQAQPKGGTSPGLLQEAVDEASQLPRLHSLIVSWHGDVIVERYFNGARPTRLANIKSASKSVVSALVGIAIERGLIRDVKQPISAYFPELLNTGVEAEKRAITVEDLLSMRAGLEGTSNRNYGAWVQSRNWVRYALAQPLVSTPGTSMEYSTGNTHLLSAILSKVAGRSTGSSHRRCCRRGVLSARRPRIRGHLAAATRCSTPQQMLAFESDPSRPVGDRQVVPAH